MRTVLSLLAGLAMLIAVTVTSGSAATSHTSGPFRGPKANTGTVTHSVKDGKHLLTLSDDFRVPDTPDPHWQVVTSKGEVFLLQRLGIKDDKVNRSIVLPTYVTDVAKVQIWCAWAEANLGEASFSSSVMTQ